ncbi:hypothetical protein [Flavobacterium sp. PL002]|uniref:hypothetical protein n=1 Tax=Flavobacterium sp. PL002 TaxID=1897058 RepID=UPI001787ECED|nr:hypothetical protein [Flavobacterium sp. PL002]MBE0393885.1 hypothetical protein [Flavobacterium sp. PL002]
MANFQQFTYSECLNAKSFNALPGYLAVKRNQSAEVILLRLLTGTLDFENTVNRTKISQRKNFTEVDFSVNSRISSKLINEVFTIDSKKIRKAKIEGYYQHCLTRGNKIFFENLLLEFCNYFYQTKKESHATAFLHLYRATELISYSFPLHFASKSKSYKSTYNSLKDFFTKTDGELSFFKKFVNEHLFKDNPILDLDLSIKIEEPNQNLKEQYYKAIKKLCDNNKNITIKSQTLNTEIVITRKGLTSLIIDLRNRYFHLLSGDYSDNFTSSDLSEIDLFYKNVNDIIINWLSLIYIEILINTIE